MSKRKKGTVLFRLIDGGDERISRRCPEELWCRINSEIGADEADAAVKWLNTAEKGDMFESDTGKYELEIL
jgi:hypothetical protein